MALSVFRTNAPNGYLWIVDTSNYNALSNIPFGGGGHGKPEPIRMSADDAILNFAKAAH